MLEFFLSYIFSINFNTRLIICIDVMVILCVQGSSSTASPGDDAARKAAKIADGQAKSTAAHAAMHRVASRAAARHAAPPGMSKF